MALKASYKTKAEVPAEVADYYVERDGQFVLDVEGGVKTATDVAAVKTALDKEKLAHKQTKDQLGAWAALGDNVEAVQAQIDRIPELEASGAAAGDAPAKIEAAVAAKVAQVQSKNDRALAAEKKRADEAETRANTLAGEKKSRQIGDAIRSAASTSKVIDSAIADVLMYERLFDVDDEGKIVTRDGVGVAPGLEPAQWITDMQAKRPHWWPASEGGGAGGNNGNRGGGQMFGRKNPWAGANWNLTDQGQVIKEFGLEKAEKMAKQVGSFVGATAPPKAA